MKDMSNSRQRSRDLVSAYEHSLEHQIVGKGSSLVCSDEELWAQAEGLLTDGDAREAHHLDLDPLRVMEESLKAAAPAAAAAAAATAAANARRGRSKGGLQGLAKAFEVMEQAALNLYLSPWREEYKIVKMYSGMFTHYIKPVLSMPQIEKLFGLLGYQLSSPRHEQLRLQSAPVGPASLDDFLHLSYGFFLARCECHLLLTALEKNAGDVQWELNMVRERQRGSSLQVSLDNTRKKLEVSQPPFDGEQEVDLYTDEQVNGGPREAAVSDDSPRSLTWVAPSSASPSAVKPLSNGVTSLSSFPTSLPAREDVHISTLNCQISKTSPLQLETARGSANAKQAKHPCEESTFDMGDSQLHSLQAEPVGLSKSVTDTHHYCSCLQSACGCARRCTECDVLHDITCAFLEHCERQGHQIEFDDIPVEEIELRAGPPQGGSLRVSTSPGLTSNSAAMSSLVLHDPRSMIQSLPPMGFHECCNLTRLDPEVLCITCQVFHSGSCREKEHCKTQHMTKQLGVCLCGKKCCRRPLVLCRYCGNEFCSDCWYRSPLVCTCGQTFDQSSSV